MVAVPLGAVGLGSFLIRKGYVVLTISKPFKVSGIEKYRAQCAAIASKELTDAVPAIAPKNNNNSFPNFLAVPENQLGLNIEIQTSSGRAFFGKGFLARTDWGI